MGNLPKEFVELLDGVCFEGVLEVGGAGFAEIEVRSADFGAFWVGWEEVGGVGGPLDAGGCSRAYLAFHGYCPVFGFATIVL